MTKNTNKSSSKKISANEYAKAKLLISQIFSEKEEGFVFVIKKNSEQENVEVTGFGSNWTHEDMDNFIKSMYFHMHPSAENLMARVFEALAKYSIKQEPQKDKK